MQSQLTYDENARGAPRGRDLSPYEGIALATIGQRLSAYVVDLGAFFSVCFLIAGGGALASALSLEESLLLAWLGFSGLCGFFGLAAVQLGLLLSRGQSIGKRLLGIKIVDARDGRSHPGWVSLLLMRTLLPSLINYGCGLFVFIDALFIFRAERRCLHDDLAKTHVVQIGT